MQTLPSDRRPAAPDTADVTLAPFRGVRYAPDRVRDLATVTSPPYDLIDPGTVARLAAADPHNVVRLILPGACTPPPRHGDGAEQDTTRVGDDHGGRGAPGPGRSTRDGDAGAATAAATLCRWLATGVLVRDPEPALYVYEQHHPKGTGPGGSGTQRGLIGALRLAPPSTRRVLPHEDVMPAPVADRRNLMEATRANLEPIFLLYDSDTHGTGPTSVATRLVTKVAEGRPPLLSAVTDDGVRHRLWAVTDPTEQAMVAADLADRSLLIADGHHRYAAYLALQSRRHAAGDGAGPWDYGLAFLVDAAAYPPMLGAIHRVVPGLPPARAVERAAGVFRVRDVAGGLDEAARALDDAGRDGVAFLLVGDGRSRLLTDPDQAALAAALPADRSPRWRSLAPSILAEFLVKRVWGLPDNEPAVLAVHGDAATAARAARERNGTAVISTPVSVSDVHAVAAAGERMPRKSTSFGPKPRTGLVMRIFESDR